MTGNQATLIEFEQARYAASLIPPLQSNSFYQVGDGEINLLTLKDHPDNYRFDLYTNKGQVRTGPGTFYVSGNVYDTKRPYDSMTIIQNTTVFIDGCLDISKGNLEVHGTIVMLPGSSLIMSKGAQVILYPDSMMTISDDTTIQLTGDTTRMTIYGRVDVHLNQVYSIVDVKGITIDSAADVNVTGIMIEGRPTSFTDYEALLRDRVINMHTQGETTTAIGRIGYNWRGGTPLNQSQVIQLCTLNHDAVLGDFKLSVLGVPENDIPNRQIVSEVLVKRDTTLYISQWYGDHRFIHPELYLGIIIGNNRSGGKCIVEGTLIVDGVYSFITLDRGGSIYVEEGGHLILRNQSTLQSSYSLSERILVINGTVTIDTIDQLKGFDPENIYFGENGKLVILNPDPGERKVLFTLPNGIQSSELYRLFKNRIEHIEYHISNNTGIGIDTYMEYYSRDLRDWIGGYRIENAIHKGYVVWHDGGFIQLDRDVIPWVGPYTTLLEASQVFKTSESVAEKRLQDVVNRLIYAGSGNITFVFIHGTSQHEATMMLHPIDMLTAYNYPMSDTYRVTTDGDGQLFLRNNVTDTNPDTILHPKSMSVDITEKMAIFSID